jgi:YidC/Oxa1 family membrane protein insertase
MDRNTIIGLVLIAIILFGSTFFFKSSEDKPAQTKQTPTRDSVVQAPDTVKTIVHDTSAADQKTPVAADVPAGWTAFAVGQEQQVTLQNDDIIVKISTKGGTVSYTELKKYKRYDGQPLVLITPESSTFGYGFDVGNDNVNTGDLYFTPREVSATGVTMAVTLPGGETIQQVYKLDKEGYLLHYDMNLVNMNKVIPKKTTYIDLHWEADGLKHEKDSSIAAHSATVYYQEKEETPTYLDDQKDDKKEFKGTTQWVSFKQQFFSQTLIAPQQPFINTQLVSQTASKPGTLKHYTADLTLSFEHKPLQSYKMHFYLGPLHYKTLRAVNDQLQVDDNLQLERQIPLGWSVFRAVNKYIIIPVFNLLKPIGNYGIIILFLAIFIKILVLPFTYKSYMSTAKMRILKPELDDLKKKHEGDMARQQQEQMKLYRKAGVSPFGGCLPLLLQLPILIAMFRFFPASIELRQAKFLWAHDLSTYDSIWDFGYVPIINSIYGDHVSLFTILMTISTLIYTRLNNSLTPQQPEFKWLSYLMPVMFLGFLNNYSAGLSLYYFYFNILTFAQQYLFKLFINEDKLKHKIEENKKKPTKKSGLQARLEEMSKRQQELARQKQTNGAPKKPTRRK